MMTHSLIRIESFSMGKIGTKYNDQSDTYFTKSCKGSPNGMTRMVSVALITMSCKKNDIVAVELRKRAKETVSRARNHLGAKTEEGGGRIGRRKEREEMIGW